MLNKILKGTDTASQIKLDNLVEMIGENPNIAWYPSSGTDFRDLLEAETRTKVSPDLYFHTDYLKKVVIVPGVIFNDGKTEVNILEIEHLTINAEVHYRVSPEFADFPKDIYAKPTILLLDILINYDGGQIKKPVLFWYFENINFLDEVLLKFKIPISHIIKVCEGTAWGGSRESISICYAFLSILKTQYLLIDNSAEANLRVIKYLRDKHEIELKNFRLINIAQRRSVRNWSQKLVVVVRIEHLEEVYTVGNFNNNLEIIRKFK